MATGGLPARISASVYYFLDKTFRPCPACQNLELSSYELVPIKLTELRSTCRGCSLVLQAVQIQVPGMLPPAGGVHTISISTSNSRGTIRVNGVDAVTDKSFEFQLYSDP
jgi:hypothetical protein